VMLKTIFTTAIVITLLFFMTGNYNVLGQCTTPSASCDEYISNVTVGTINNSSACTAGGYIDYSGSQSTAMVTGTSYAITVTNGNPYASDQCGIWVDWNADGDFADANETITVTGTPGNGPYTATITPPCGTSAGNKILRCRILYTGTVSACGATSWGETEDYNISLTAGGTMSYSSSTVVQASTSNVTTCQTDAEILGLQVVMSAGCGTVNLTEIQMNMTGSTAGTSDVNLIHVYYTGTSSTFSASSAFDGAGTTPAGGTITINGSQALAAGTNYFWIAYDSKLTGTVSNVVDGQVTQITVNGSNQTPTATNPAGSRTLIACVPSPGGVSSGLLTWLKPSVGVTTSGVNVTAWTNQVSGGPAMTVNGSPDYVSSGYNYNPYINFTLSSATGGDYLSFADINMQSFFYVAKLDDLTRKSTHLATYDDVTFGSPCGSCALHGGENGGSVAQYFESGYGSGNFQAAGVWRKNGVATAYNTNHSGNYDIVTALGQASASCNVLMGGQTDNLPGFDGRARDWLGPVGEIINYSGAITTAQANKVESYLAVKHGITLGGNGSASVGYVNTSGTTIWTSATGYHYDVTGIGCESTVELLQQNKSTSINVPSAAGATDMPFIIAHDDITTPTNIEEGAYIIVGHDNGTLVGATVSYTHEATPIQLQQNRIFRIQTTGLTGGKAMTALKIQLDMTQVPGTSGTGLGGANDPTNLRLLLDGNTTFGQGSGTDTDERAYAYESVSGNIITFSIPVGDLPSTGVFYFRFASITNINTPLAVVMGDVLVDCEEINPVLQWETFSEYNLDYFDVQISNDGLSYVSFKKILGDGGNTSGAYYQLDLPISNELNYVRIVEVDINGDVIIFGPYAYNCNKDELFIYPNPIEDFVTIESSNFGQASLTILDELGRIVYFEEADLSLPKTIHVDLAKGVYMLSIQDNLKTKNIRFIKH
jgi:hypothetical protein